MFISSKCTSIRVYKEVEEEEKEEEYGRTWFKSLKRIRKKLTRKEKKYGVKEISEKLF